MADEMPIDSREIARLRDEVEQLRTALETSAEEVERLAEDRDRLLGRVTSQARELQAINTASRQARSGQTQERTAALTDQARATQEHEELRVAFEEMQVLTEELEVANTSLQESNRALDERVAERTRELEQNNAALAASEARFRTLVEGVPQLVWRAVDGGRWTWASPQWTAYTGQSAAASEGSGWLAAVFPDDRPGVEQVWSTALKWGEFQAEHRLRRARDGAVRWFQTRATAVRDEHGAVVEWLGTSTDVDDLRRLQERQAVLLAELQHRVRNILAVIRSITARTAETSGSVEEFAAHLDGRLGSLARTQVLLTRQPGTGVDVEIMVREELLAQAAQEPAVDVGGPEVRLSPKAAEILTLAVHELATNAVKYGALAAPAGVIQVRWDVREEDGETWFTLRWTESGVRVAVAAPRREGFGTDLIKHRVPYELEGIGHLEFLPGGVRATLAFPLRPGDSVLQTDPAAVTTEGVLR